MTWIHVVIIMGATSALGAVLYIRYPWKWVHKAYHPEPVYRETRTLSRCLHCHAEWLRKYWDTDSIT